MKTYYVFLFSFLLIFYKVSAQQVMNPAGKTLSDNCN